MKISQLFLSLYLTLLMQTLNPSATETFILVDSTNTIVKSIGDIHTRLAPCSTFKIVLSLIGYDLNILKNEYEPQWDFQEEYYDALASWRTAQTPTSWIKNSCVWYSQLLAPLIGKEQLQKYMMLFDYGNQDLSGDPGKNNGLTNAWLMSSLKISPLEQVKFLNKLLHYALPTSRHAITMTRNIIFIEQLPHGWKLFGKTGLGTQEAMQLGWLVGWIEKDGFAYPFSYTIQDTTIVPSNRIIRVKELLDKYFLKTKTL